MMNHQFIQRYINSAFLRNLGETFFIRILLAGVTFLTQVIIARSLGPDGRGLYSVYITIGLLGIQFGNLGLHSANTYFVAKNSKILGPLIGNSLILSIGLGAALSLVLLVFFPLLPQLYTFSLFLLFLIILYVSVGTAYILLQNLLLGIHKVRLYNFFEVFYKCSIFILIVLLWKLSYADPVHYFTAQVFSASTCVIALAYILIRYSNASHTPSLSLFKQNIRFGFKAYIAAFFAFLLVRMDILMIEWLKTTTDVGFYSVAASLADVIYLFPTVLATLLFPKLSSINSDISRWKLAQKALYGVLLVTSIIGILGMTLSDYIVNLFYGKEYLASSPSFKILALAMIFYGGNNILSIFLASIGLPLFGVYVWGIALAANAALNLVLIPAQGIIGAAEASLICYALVFFLQFIYVYWRNFNEG